jgi:hypothetical protein
MLRIALLCLLVVLGCGGRSKLDEWDAEGRVPDRELMHVPFLPGIRQDIARQLAPPGTLTAATNVRYGRQGGIFPRPGTASIGTGTDNADHIISTSQSIGWINTVGNVGLIGSAGKAFAYDETGSRFRFQGMYASAEPVRRRNGIIGDKINSFGRFPYGMAVTSTGYTMLAASDTFNVEYFIDSPDGTRIIDGNMTGTGRVVVLGVGANFVLIWQSTFNINAVVVTPGSPVTFASIATVGVLEPTREYWDAVASTNGTEWYLAYGSTTTEIRLDRFSGTTSQANSTIAVTGNCPVSLYQDATALWVGVYHDPTVTGDVQIYTRNTSTVAAVAGPFTIASTADLLGPPLIGSSGTAGTVFFVYRRTTGGNTGAPWATVFGTVTSAGSITGPFNTWGVFPLTKPGPNREAWCIATDYVLVSSAALRQTAEQRAVLLRWPETVQAVPATVELSGNTFAADMVLVNSNYSVFTQIASGPSSSFAALPRLYETNTLDQRIGIEVLEYDRDTSRSTVSTTQTIVVSGQPVEIPGNSTSERGTSSTSSDALSSGALEIGFPARPRILSATASTTGPGSLTLLGTYSFIAVWELIDDHGRIHRSAPSVPVTVTLTGTENSVAMTLTALGYTQRQSFNRLATSRVELVVYRTVANGATYHRVSGMGTINAWDAADGILSHTEDSSDADALEGAILYTDGGVKDNALAPSCRVVFKTEDRLACALGWDRNVVTVSKIIVPGEPPQFTDDDAFRIVFPDNLTAAAAMDGGIVGFSSNAIYVVSGDGPNDQGIGQFSPPRIVAQGIGATSEVVLETADGLVFQDVRGVYLLPRGFGSPVFIGAGIQASTAPGAYDTLLGAAVHQDGFSDTAHLLMSDTGGGDVPSAVFVMDHDIQDANGRPAWSMDTFGFEQSQVAIGPWPGGIAIAPSAGLGFALYFMDSARAFGTDASNAVLITTSITTADIRPAGIAAQCRIETVTGLFSDPDGGTLGLSVTPDGTATAYSRNWALSSATGSVYRELTATQPWCTAFSLTASVSRSGSVMGPAMHGFSVEVKSEKRLRNSVAAER